MRHRRKQLPAWILRAQRPHDGTLQLVVPKTSNTISSRVSFNNIFWRLFFCVAVQTQTEMTNSETRSLYI